MRNRKAAAVLAAAAFVIPSVAFATDYTWTGSDPTNPTLWDTVSVNWNNDTLGAGNPAAWVNNAVTPNNAFFGAGPGAVTLAENVIAGIIGFSNGTGGWTLGGSGTITSGNEVTAGVPVSLTLISTADNTIAANIVDPGVGAARVFKTNGGVLTLTGTNTYSGGTALNAGTLAISSLDNVGAGSITFAGGTLQVNGTALTSLDGRIASGTDVRLLINDAANVFTLNTPVTAGVLVKSGPGTLVVSGVNTNAGNTSFFGGGIVRLSGGDNRLSGTSLLLINDNGTTVDLNGNNQAVAALDGQSSGSILTNSTGGTKTLTINGTTGATYRGQINDGAAGAVAVTKLGSSTQTMSGSSTYSGDTRIQAGVMQVDTTGSAASLGTGNIVMAGGTLRVNTTTTFGSTRSITMEGNAGLDNRVNGATVTFDGTISGSGNLTREANSAAQPNGTVVLGGNSVSYTGLITINGNALIGGDAFDARRGGLVVSSNNALGTTGQGTTINASGWLGFQGGVQYTTAEPVTVASNTQQTTGTIRSLSGDNLFAGPIVMSSTATQFGVDAGSSLELTGAVSGAGSLNKVGAGTLIFSTSQAYAGATNVALQGNGTGQIVPAGTFKLVGSNGTVAASSVRVGPTGSFLIDNTSNSGADVTRTASVRLAQGAVMTVNGNDDSDTSDVFGQLRIGPTFGPGEAFIVVNPGAGRTSTLKFADLFREGAANSQGNGGSLNLRGPNFGQAPGANVARAVFSGAVATGHWLTITDTVAGQTSFVVNDVNGLRPLIASEYTLPAGGTMPNNSSARALLNVGSSATDVAGASVLSSLSIQASNVTVTGGAGTSLRVGTTGGGILSTGTGNALTVPTLNVGSSGAINELYTYVEGDLTIRSNIVHGGTATAATLVKTGPGELRLLGTNTWAPNGGASPTLLWANRIHNGTLSFAKAENLGASNNIYALYSGGELRLLDLATRQALDPLATAVVTIPQAIRLGTAAAVGIDPSSSRIRVDAGSTMEIGYIDTTHATATGTGFTKVGAGDLRLTTSTSANGSDNQTGAVYLAEGSLTMAGTSVLMRGGQFFASPGTVVNIDSSTRAAGSNNRLGVATFADADINVIGSSVNDTTDSNGGFKLAAGGTNVTVTTAGKTTVFNSSGSLTQAQGGSVVFSGTGLGTAATNVAQVKFSSGAAMTGGIIPYALADETTGGIGTAFATYGANGITSLATTNGGISQGGNVNLTASDNSAGTVNSLTLNGSAISAGGGMLKVSSGGILNRGGANTIDAATLDFDGVEGVIHANTDLLVNSQVVGSRGLTKAGPGKLTLAGSNTYTGPTHVNGGTLEASASLDAGSDVTLHSNAGLAFNSSGSLTVANDIGGQGTLTKSGSGTVTVTGSNTYSGATTAAGGTLVLRPAAWGPVLDPAGGAVMDGGRLVFDYAGSGSPQATVLALLQAGRAGGFSGTQLRNATPDANHGIGWIDDAATSQLTLRGTWYGDANLNGHIDRDDYALTDLAMATGMTRGWVDYNYDGATDMQDYLLLDTSAIVSGMAAPAALLAEREAQFGSDYIASLTAAVPEPASIGLAAMAAVWTLGRRRKGA